MANHCKQFELLGRVMRLATLVVFAMTLGACTSTPKTGKHLFILSGQSNMTGAVKNGFT